MVERFNCTIESQMSKFVDANQRDWDVHVPLLLMAYRLSVHDTTGCMYTGTTNAGMRSTITN